MTERPVNDARFLLVDDEEEYVTTVAERLEIRGLRSDVVLSGEAALAYLERHEPDVVVLDLRMPGIDGIETLQRIKRSHPRVEVIIATGHGSEKEERAAMQLGAFAYLQKPVDIDVLCRTMERAGRERQRRNGEVSSSEQRVGRDDGP
jgi:two-component system response regulator CpxR